MPNASALLFVYGTLRRDRRGRLHPLLRGRARYLGPASVYGRLYDLGAYPGLLPGGRKPVRGELYLLQRPQQQWPALDHYEACRPDDPQAEYVRQWLQVHRPGGTTLQAWCYVYNRPLLPRQRLHGGDYRKVRPSQPTPYPVQGEKHA